MGREQASPTRTEEPSFSFPFRALIIGFTLVVVVAAATIAVLGYGEGRIPASSWAEFSAPDGRCSIELPGSPVAEKVEPNPASTPTRGGERFVSTGWYSRARAWVGWQNLDPAWAKQVADDRGGALTTPILEAERDRRKAEVGGTVTRQVTVKYGEHVGLEVQMETPRGQLVERYVLVLEGNEPRLYFMGLEAKNAASGGMPGPAAERILNSFRVMKR